MQGQGRETHLVAFAIFQVSSDGGLEQHGGQRGVGVGLYSYLSNVWTLTTCEHTHLVHSELRHHTHFI